MESVEKDYKNEIVNTLHKENADVIMKQAKANFKKMYESIITEVKGRFKLNLILALIIGGIYLALNKEVSVDDMYKINSNIIGGISVLSLGILRPIFLFIIRNKVKNDNEII